MIGILALPVLPVNEFESTIIPTPMSTAQTELPLQLLIYDASGEKVLQKKLSKAVDGICPEIMVFCIQQVHNRRYGSLLVIMGDQL